MKSYLLIQYYKPVEFSSRGREVIKGVTNLEKIAKKWVKGYREDGFEKRIYKPIQRITE